MKKDKAKAASPKNAEKGLLSYCRYTLDTFPNIEETIQSFRLPQFAKLPLRKRFKQINQTLYQLIREIPSPSFALGAVLDYCEKINKEKLLSENYDLSTFEFWLNNFSELSDQENSLIRGKIIGKHIPRSEYQAFFPIGMGKTYFGTHFITAHTSPDVDTMIASFWGWMDAFAARVGSGLHQWCLPGGPPDSPFSGILSEIFGKGFFSGLARPGTALTLTARDLTTQKQFTKALADTQISTIAHGPHEGAIILVSEHGGYLGDWRSSDVEYVRQIIVLIKSCLHWFENNLHTQLITLFAKTDLTVKDLRVFNAAIFDVKIKDSEPVQDFNDKQKNDLNELFHKVLDMEGGLECTFRDFNAALSKLSINGMTAFQKEVESLPSAKIFDQTGKLKENRPQIFNYLKDLIKQLDEAIFEVRTYVERLDVVLHIKYKVLGMPYTFITQHSDVDEIRQKMVNRDFLTVNIQEQDGSLFPVGIVRASDLRDQGLGTVSLRDFCNLEEMKMAPYLDVISVVDHHKSSLKTLSVPTALIGDAQSCNVLIAEQMFAINDKYSLGGMTTEQIENQISENTKEATNSSRTRILQKLLQRRIAAGNKSGFAIHPAREYIEYYSCLQAIIDDTDLLTKVSQRDLDCVAQLLNRLKSLSSEREMEIIAFDDLPMDKNFVKASAMRILQQEDMYALYSQIYMLRESEVQENLSLCEKGKPSNIFLDTKEQNGCARVGQTKMFSSNFPFFFEHAKHIREIWLDRSQEVFKEKTEIDLHLHMISTIPSAHEVYHNQIGPYKHQDELWIWIPVTQAGCRHLNSFLSGFQYTMKNYKNSMSLEFIGAPPAEFMEIFEHHFPEIPLKITCSEAEPFAILSYPAGSVNSRKSMISPNLPRLV